MNKVTFLGPVGATFSHQAYDALACKYGLLPSSSSQLIPATTNKEILRMIRDHGGYGAIAMETLAEMRVNESLESFIDLLKVYRKADECSFCITGAIRLELNFCLMLKMGARDSWNKTIVAHPKAIGACQSNIEKRFLKTVECSSNGEAARLVAESDEYSTCAALGPHAAAEKFGLEIVHDRFEDRKAVTTFFLITPKTRGVCIGKNNRALIVFTIPHIAGSLVKALIPFERYGLNLIQIHSTHSGNQAYNFAVEIDVELSKLQTFERALKAFEKCVLSSIAFGPFEVCDT